MEKQFFFKVWEKDSLLNPDDPVVKNPIPMNITSYTTIPAGSWVAEWQDDTDGGQTNPPEYYFIATVASPTGLNPISIRSYNLLYVNPCTPEPSTSFCSRLGKTCGSITSTDNCGVSRTVNCGTCAAGYFCQTNGICTLSCTDNDSGLNYYTYGKVTGTDEYGQGLPAGDYCGTGGSIIMEGFCKSNGYASYYSYNCSNGCSRGVCRCNSTTQCNDNNICTTDTCSSGVCSHPAITNCCTSAAQCNDNNVCTTDSCSNNLCVHARIASCTPTSQ